MSWGSLAGATSRAVAGWGSSVTVDEGLAARRDGGFTSTILYFYGREEVIRPYPHSPSKHVKQNKTCRIMYTAPGPVEP